MVSKSHIPSKVDNFLCHYLIDHLIAINNGGQKNSPKIRKEKQEKNMKYLSLFILLISINSGAASIGILNCSDQNPIYLYSNIEVTKSKIIARGNKIYSREEYDKSLLEECPLFYYSLEACDTDGDVDCDLSGYKWEKRARQTNIISIKLGGNFPLKLKYVPCFLQKNIIFL